MSKKSDKKIEKYVNQSNVASTTLIKISSATSYKIIKYGTHKLEMKFENKQSKIPLETYKEMDLLNADNWKGIDWSDFSCTYSLQEFCKELNISDGGKQRDEIREMMENVTSEKIWLKYDDRDKWFPWFVEAEYIHPENEKDVKGQSIKLRFNPGVIGAALLHNDNYSHIELLVIGKIKSFYGLRIYELIKSFYNKKGRYGNEKGIWKTDWYTVDYLKKFLQCELSYIGRPDNFLTKALKNPVEEINKVCEDLDINLHVELEFERGGRGGKQIKGIRFVCSEFAGSYSISKDDSKALREEKRELNDEALENQKLKEKYKDQWIDISNKVLELNQDNPMFRQPGFREGMFFEASVLNYIKENYEK